MSLDIKRDLRMTLEQWERWGRCAGAAGIPRQYWVRRACDERAALEEAGGAVVVVQLPAELAAWLRRSAAADLRDPSGYLAALVQREAERVGRED